MKAFMLRKVKLGSIASIPVWGILLFVLVVGALAAFAMILTGNVGGQAASAVNVTYGEPSCANVTGPGTINTSSSTSTFLDLDIDGFDDSTTYECSVAINNNSGLGNVCNSWTAPAAPVIFSAPPPQNVDAGGGMWGFIISFDGTLTADMVVDSNFEASWNLCSP